MRALGWICAIGLILLMLLFLRIGIRITIQNGTIRIAPQLAGISLCRISPQKDKPIDLKRKTKKRKPEERKTEKDRSWGISELLRTTDNLGAFLSLVKKGLTLTKERLLRRIVVNRFALSIAVGDRDPMKATLGFGALSAGVYSAAAALSHLVTLKHRRISLYPDYAGQTCRVDFDFQMWLRLWNLLFLLIRYWKLLSEIRALSLLSDLKKNKQTAALPVS